MWAEAIAGGLAGLTQGISELQQRQREDEKQAEETRRWNLTHLLAENQHTLEMDRLRLEQAREARDAALDPYRKQQMEAVVRELEARITDMEGRRQALEEQLGLDRTRTFLDTVGKVRPGTRLPDEAARGVEPWAIRLALDPDGRVRQMVPHELPLQHALQMDIARQYTQNQTLGNLLMYSWPGMPTGWVSRYGIPTEAVPPAGGSYYAGIATKAITNARTAALRSVDNVISRLLETNQIRTDQVPEVRNQLIEQLTTFYQGMTPEQFWGLDSGAAGVPAAESPRVVPQGMPLR